jgi:histidyl-tRNA synthetase
MVAEKQGLTLAKESHLDVYLVALGTAASQEIGQWLHKLRSNGIQAERDYMGRSMKAQMREANKLKARFVLILGEDELNNKVFSLKDMKEGSQSQVPFEALLPTIQKRLVP